MKNQRLTFFFHLRIAIGALLFFAAALSRLNAQCAPDVTPPTVFCINGLSVNIGTSGPNIPASDLLVFAADNCSPDNEIQFFLEMAPASAAPPSTTFIDASQANSSTFEVVLWAVDTAGNAANCSSFVQIQNVVCNTTPLVCNDLVTISLDSNDYAELHPLDILEGGPYNCIDSFVVQVDKTPPFGNGPWIPAVFNAPDQNNTYIARVRYLPNGNMCWGNVKITDCNLDTLPPVVVCDLMAVLSIDTVLSTSATLLPSQIDNGTYDNCSSYNQLGFSLQLFGSGNPLQPSLTFNQTGDYLVALHVADLSGNSNFCVTTITVQHKPRHFLEGTVFSDANYDCNFQPGELPLSNWQVVATRSNGQVFTTFTDTLGRYSFSLPLPADSFSVVLTAPFNYSGGICPISQIVVFTHPDSSQRIIRDIPVLLDQYCPLLYVDLATPRIRGCFSGQYYINYTNASVYTSPNTYVEVSLDYRLQYQSSSIPGTQLSPGTYRFDLGDLAPGESGNFILYFQTDCNIEFGATHCSEAHIFPDSLCPRYPQWSGADITVNGKCQGDSIYFEIKNTGTGATIAPLNYIVVEDVLMRTSNTFVLGPGETMPLPAIEADGSTFLLQADQEPFHPFPGLPTVAVEGCSGFTPGIVTQFDLNSSNPFIAVDCRENIGSYDPNDKQALPRGFGNEHFILPNTTIEYMIRFQNTGTDTAYNIVVVDTLSSALDASAILPGASSHNYRLDIRDGNILYFIFENILLPDSNVNLAGSQGFVQFRIPQAKDNPIGTQISNKAAIYFDLNAPIITNSTFHTVGTQFITSAINYSAPQQSALSIYPNPTTGWVYFRSEAASEEKFTFNLTDAMGRSVRRMDSVQLPWMADFNNLSPGVYFFRFDGPKGELLWSGEIMVR